MKVLVTVAAVGSLAEDFEIEEGAVPERFVEYDLNEYDEYAIEAAVSLREAGVAEEVVIVTIGPERAEDTMRMALAKDADRAIRIWGPELADEALESVRTRAALLGPVVEAEDPSLVLSGVQAEDDGYAATGVALARTLDLGWAAVVNDLTLAPEEGTARIRRELEGGLEEVSTVDLPAVLTVQTGLNDPRYASLRGLQEARQQEIECHSPDELGVDLDRLGPGVCRGALAEPEPRGDTEYVEGEPSEQAGAVADLLVDAGVVEE
jgi:electron transfer flavoprotein beta subunit